MFGISRNDQYIQDITMQLPWKHVESNSNLPPSYISTQTLQSTVNKNGSKKQQNSEAYFPKQKYVSLKKIILIFVEFKLTECIKSR